MFWLNILGGVALGLIERIVASPVVIHKKSMDKKAMQTIFHLVLTFNYIANKLSPNRKNIIRIKKKTPSIFLMLACIKSHNYNQDSNKKDIKILLLFLFSSTVCSPIFVRLAHNINDVSRKHFVALPIYQVYAKNNRDKLQKEYFNIFGKQVIHHLFSYKAHRLSCSCNPLVVATE